MIWGHDLGQPGEFLERNTDFLNYDAYAMQPTLIQGPRVGVADDIAMTYWAQSTPGVACASVGGGACGQLKTVTNAAGHVTTFDLYYTDGRLQQMTDPNGLVTVYTYDSRGRLKTVTETPSTGSARFTGYDYHPTGELMTVTQPNNQTLNYFWTAAHLLDYVTDNAGNIVDVSHDSRGNQTGTANKYPGGTTTRSETLTYDPRNYLDTRKQGFRLVTDLSFDATGRLTDELDPLSRNTHYDYDPLNRLKQVIDPQNGASFPTMYGYNVHDNLTSVQTPNGAGTSYVYDDLGNLRKEVSPDRGVTLYGYDEAGNMTCKADGRYATTSSTTCENVTNHWVYTHDALNRVTSIDYLETGGTLDVVFNYDTRAGALVQKGRLRQMINIKGATTVTRNLDYDAWGNVTFSQQIVADGSTTKTYNTSYEFDGMNQLKKITYPSGRFVDYNRYPNGRIQDVKATINGQQTTIVALATYDPFGPPNAIGFGNGMTQQRGSNPDGTPESQWLFDAVPNPDLTYDARAYTVSDVGNIDEITDLVGTDDRTYYYDALNRLTRDSKASGVSPTYTYDGNGNRKTRTAGTYPAQSFTYVQGTNRDASTAYDGMGNSLKNLATYDASGRLDSLTDAQNMIHTSYNGQGELARTVVGFFDLCTNTWVTTAVDDLVFTPDGRALTIRTTSTSPVNVDYVWLDNLPVAQIQDSFDSYGNPIATELTYLHSDHLGTPRVGTSQARTVTWRNQGDAFGIPQLSGAATVRLRFPGQVALGFQNQVYNYYRDYDPNLGRYLESDPIGIEGGLNTYSYVGANPLKYTDVYGLDSFNCQRNLKVGPVKLFRAGPLFHQFLCTDTSDGRVCRGLGPSSSNVLDTPGILEDDKFRSDSCERVADDNKCVDACLLSVFNSPIPNYSVDLSRGANCQTYATGAVSQCLAQCKVKR